MYDRNFVVGSEKCNCIDIVGVWSWGNVWQGSFGPPLAVEIPNENAPGFPPGVFASGPCPSRAPTRPVSTHQRRQGRGQIGEKYQQHHHRHFHQQKR